LKYDYKGGSSVKWIAHLRICFKRGASYSIQMNVPSQKYEKIHIHKAAL